MTTCPDRHYIACHDCDLLVARTALPEGVKALCPRCGATLRAPRKNSIERGLAMAITSLLLFPPANTMPIMGLRVMGMVKEGTIIDGVHALIAGGQTGAALLVFIAAIAAPALKLFLLFAVSLCLRLDRRPFWVPYFFRLYLHLDEWAMLEVYMLGIVVAVVKLKSLAAILPGPGLYCFVALLLSATTMSSFIDPEAFWEAMDGPQSEVRP